MRIVLFTHSIRSDWNHGNAHFQRGLLRALQARGHATLACEARAPWSVAQLVRDHGPAPLREFASRFPDLEVAHHGLAGSLDEELDALTRGAELVLVHEFNPPELVNALGALRRRRDDFLLLFHDTHHRAVTAPGEIARLDLAGYDGVLAFGASLARVYRRELGHPRVWTLHEAADVTVFRPLEVEPSDDVVWIGNWGDEERSAELRAYLVESSRRLPELRFAVHGVRYPAAASREMVEAGIDFRGWVANHRVPEAFARARMTVHVPRGPYLDRLPGIPTIRPFEAMACGIPLVSTPWPDVEGLFRAGEDYLVARSPAEMRAHLLRLAGDPGERAALAARGRRTILERHTCDHRAGELEAICGEALAALPGASR